MKKSLVRRAPEEDTHMAAPPSTPDANIDLESDHESAPSMPRWVKMFGIVFIVLVLLLVILHLTGGGFKGHTPGGHTPPASVIEHGVQQS